MAIAEQTKIVESLQQLVRLDYDAIEAYEAAVDRIDDAESKARLTDFTEDHRRHTDNLGAILRQMGADVPDGPDAKRFLTEGKVVLGGLIGDKAILAAMRANEALTNKSYEEAVKHLNGDVELNATLEANLADERRHRDWIEERMEQL